MYLNDSILLRVVSHSHLFYDMRKKEVNMSNDLIKKLTEALEKDINDLGYELVDIEFVTESKERYLRFFIYSENGVGVDDCEIVSKALDPKLDELDLISSSYYLEVSSPDLSRPLKTDRDLERNIGNLLDFNLYKKVDNKKEYRGNLVSFDKDFLIIEENDKVIKLERKDVSKITVAIVF